MSSSLFYSCDGLCKILVHQLGLGEQYILPPLWNNIISALLTVLYVKVVLNIGSLIRVRLGRASESRKFVHVCAGCWLVFWPLFDVTHWSWRLNVLVPAVMAIKLFYKGAILADPNDIDVQTMSRSSSPSELLFGPLQFTIVMIWCGVAKFMTLEAVVIMAALGVGDGIAPLIGKFYGRISYRFPLSTEKTVEGSILGVFCGTMVGCHFFLYVLGLPYLSLSSYVVVGIIATIIEATAPGNFDNVIVPTVLHFTLLKYPSLLHH